MLVFKEKIQYIDPLNIIFLCGSKFKPKSGKDKRVILKEYLSQKLNNSRMVILEENFVFSNSSKKYLAYDDIFLKNLFEVEKLAALYADKVIIIHETLSTAAEIGMLAGDIELTPKICVLVPDDISIEENKVSSFIRFAFFNEQDQVSRKPRKIVYYPDVEIYRSSKNKSEYHTFFYQNEIGDNLGNQILDFVNKPNVEREIKFKKSIYGKSYNDKGTLSYSINEEEKKIDISLCAGVLKIQLLALFSVDTFKSLLRSENHIKDHVTNIEDNYKQILVNTVCYIEGLDPSDFSIQVDIIDIASCNLRQAIGYFLYMLQAIELIKLEQQTENLASNVRKVRFSEQLNLYTDEIEDYISETSKTSFGGII